MRKHYFTLMEVMIAATILAMSVVASLGIVGAARSGLLRAEKRWARQHILGQVAECYLLAGPGAIMPEGVLPQGFSSVCHLYAVDDLPEEAQESIRGWLLGEFHIEVFDVSGKLMEELRVRKMIKEDDLQ
ncbi:MAG: hypothetical protein PHG44_06750 [Lentisphaeria bacterium]|mgnify:CR=1 FL=1|jgi:hypothetical protein|nr:hypothetical protein [Lentisphaeria bacterium]MDY0175500.1 hypothetical protein [Lentisphaeria bacterium]NLZ59344.1 hypothetical protein [Lentisphaerota bacterium]